MDGVEIPGGWDLGVAEAEEGMVGGGVLAFGHVPAG